LKAFSYEEWQKDEWRKAYLAKNAPIIIRWLTTAFLVGMIFGAGCFWFGLKMATAR
jgi:hypothetical protein